MKNIAKTALKMVVTTAVLAGAVSTANATDYYVYQKGSSSTCDISTKAPDDYNRGSQYHLVASDSSRSGAKGMGEDAGCSSF